MSLYLSSHDYYLHEYLRKAFLKDRKMRELSPEDFGKYMELREIRKAANLCMTEMIFTKFVIRRMKIKELEWVTNNFERMTKSMYKQRDLVSAVISAFSCYIPDDNELKAIDNFIQRIKTRIEFVNTVPIPENIRLTPIQDYMDLIGGDCFINEVKTEFPMSRDLYESQKNGKMDAYLSTIMETLEKAGKAEAYKERLDEYIRVASKRKEAQEAEKEAEKTAFNLNEAKNGILLFREQFFKGIRTLDGSAKIGLSASAINHQLKHGNRGKFCILCCYFSRGDIRYRYMRGNGTFSPSFQNVGLYETLEDACQVISDYVQLYPDRAFEAVAI